MYWAEKASIKGDVPALMIFSNIYGEGQGVRKDFIESLKYLHLTIFAGENHFNDYLNSIKNSKPQVYEESLDRAAKWLEEHKDSFFEGKVSSASSQTR